MLRTMMVVLAVWLAVGLVGCAEPKKGAEPAKAAPAAKVEVPAKAAPAKPAPAPAAPAPAAKTAAPAPAAKSAAPAPAAPVKAAPAATSAPAPAAPAASAAKAVPAAPTAAAPAPAGKAVIRISCGSDTDYTDTAGVKWSADQEYSPAAKWGAMGGKTVRRDLKTVEGTTAPDVYLTERWNAKAYRFDVPNGKYTVRLHFAETFAQHTDAGKRVFSVKIGGQPALTDFDVFKEAGGFAKPVVKEFKNVDVADGKLMIEFEVKAAVPEINGIEVVPQ